MVNFCKIKPKMVLILEKRKIMKTELEDNNRNMI